MTIKSLGRKVVSYALSKLRNQTRRVYSATGDGISRARDAALRQRQAMLLNKWARKREAVTLFLAPEAGLMPHFLPHAVMARLMIDAGHPSILLSCNGLQPTCSVKMSMGLRVTAPGEVNDIACVQCRENSRKIVGAYGLVNVSLESLLSGDVIARINEIMRRNDTAPWATAYDNIEFGAACFGETLRAKGKSALEDLDAEDIAMLKALLHSALCIYFAVDTLVARFKIARIVYFGDYAYYLPAQLFAKRKNLPLTQISYAFGRDIDRRYVSLLPGFSFGWAREQVERWSQFRHIPIDPASISTIFDGALFRLYGHGGISTFSPNWQLSEQDIHKQLGLDPRRRTIVAYASSFDEVACLREFMRFFRMPFETGKMPFNEQTTWLKALVRWIESRSELQLVVRLHPRMAANARHSGARLQYAKIISELSTLPANAVVVGADSKLSSYNLAEIADVALVAWSSIGMELARFGVPVVVAFPESAVYPTGGFISFAETPADYFRTIEIAMQRKPSILAIKEAFRWSHYLNWSHIVDLSDLFPEPNYGGVPEYRTPRNAAKFLKVLADSEDAVAMKMAEFQSSEHAIATEQATIEAVIEQLIIYMMTGAVTQRSPGIRIKGADGAMTRIAKDTQAVLKIGAAKNVVLEIGGRSHQRYSPLVHRLAVMLAANEGTQGSLRAPSTSEASAVVL